MRENHSRALNLQGGIAPGAQNRAASPRDLISERLFESNRRSPREPTPADFVKIAALVSEHHRGDDLQSAILWLTNWKHVMKLGEGRSRNSTLSLVLCEAVGTALRKQNINLAQPLASEAIRFADPLSPINVQALEPAFLVLCTRAIVRKDIAPLDLAIWDLSAYFSESKLGYLLPTAKVLRELFLDPRNNGAEWSAIFPGAMATLQTLKGPAAHAACRFLTEVLELLHSFRLEDEVFRVGQMIRWLRAPRRTSHASR